MSFGIVRVQKMTSGSVKGIEIHDKREKDVSHTNQDIDFEKSNLNYDLHSNDQSFQQVIKEKIKALKLPRAVRKDAIVMSQVLVTSDSDFFKNLSEDKQKAFFEDSYNFLAERYGKNNVISSTVHLDERTPHMHFNFVPITDDGRLSAKSILNRQDLISQQTDFYNSVGKNYGLERGVQGGKKKHLEIAELKKQTAYKELQEIEKRIERLTVKAEGKKLDISNIQALQPQKTLTGAIKGISLDDIENLKKTALEGAEWKDKAIEIHKAYKSIKAELEKVLADNKKRPTIMQIAKIKNDLANSQNENDRLIDKVNDTLEKLPREVSESFLEQWNEKPQEQERGFSMER